MTTADIAKIALIGISFVLYVVFNDLLVADACRPEKGPPWLYAFIGTVSAGLAVPEIVQNDWLGIVDNVIVVSMCARIIWHWWRRRRKGKSSRVLGLIRSLGHRLVVVPVRGESSS